MGPEISNEAKFAVIDAGDRLLWQGTSDVHAGPHGRRFGSAEKVLLYRLTALDPHISEGLQRVLAVPFSPALTPAQRLSPWEVIGKNVSNIFRQMHIETEPVVTDEDISTRPASWTWVPAKRDSELGATKGAIFSHKRLRRIHSSGAFIVHAKMESVDLSLGDLSRVDLRAAILEDVTASSALFKSCSFADDIDPKEPDLAKENADKAHSAWLIEGDFKGSHFVLAKLCFAKINTASFRDASFAFANCVGTQFVGCDLSGSDFERAHLNYAQFVSVRPWGTEARIKFRNADCSHTEFRKSDLRVANFFGAILDNAAFDDVELANAIFTSASLQGADLSRSHGLKEAQLLTVKSLSGAILPKEPVDLATRFAKEVNKPPTTSLTEHHEVPPF